MTQSTELLWLLGIRVNLSAGPSGTTLGGASEAVALGEPQSLWGNFCTLWGWVCPGCLVAPGPGSPPTTQTATQAAQAEARAGNQRRSQGSGYEGRSQGSGYEGWSEGSGYEGWSEGSGYEGWSERSAYEGLSEGSPQSLTGN